MLNPRVVASAPFAALGTAAIVAGGATAAAVARHPTQHLVWMVAYLVLVVGIAQCVFGVGQALLSRHAPSRALVWKQWIVFNLGNAGVIAGTLAGSFGLEVVGTLVFAAGITLFLVGTRGSGRSGWLVAYRVLLGLILASSLVGLALSAVSHPA